MINLALHAGMAVRGFMEPHRKIGDPGDSRRRQRARHLRRIQKRGRSISRRFARQRGRKIR
jgi:hypothetical protein